MKRRHDWSVPHLPRKMLPDGARQFGCIHRLPCLLARDGCGGVFVGTMVCFARNRKSHSTPPHPAARGSFLALSCGHHWACDDRASHPQSPMSRRRWFQLPAAGGHGSPPLHSDTTSLRSSSVGDRPSPRFVRVSPCRSVIVGVLTKVVVERFKPHHIIPIRP